MSWNRQRVFRPSLVGWALLAACSGSPQEVPPEDCPDNQVSLTVSEGLTPRFSWAPRCGMASVNVFPTAGGASLWVLYSGQEAAANPFHSGITYGRAPAGAIEVTGPVPLSRGTEYTVIVYRWIGDPGGSGVLYQAGSATFQP